MPDAVQSVLNNNVTQPARILNKKNNMYTNYQLLAER